MGMSVLHHVYCLSASSKIISSNNDQSSSESFEIQHYGTNRSLFRYQYQKLEMSLLMSRHYC